MTTRHVAIAVATTFLVAGLHRGAFADETTTCEIDSWGQLKCVTSSSASSAGGGRRTVFGAFSLLILTTALVGLFQPSVTTDRGREISLGIVVGTEMFPTPQMVYFTEGPLEPEVKAHWQRKTTVTAEAWGSAVSEPAKSTAPAAGGRITVARGRVGLDAGGESAADPMRYSLMAGHLLLRAPPRRIATIALAIGASRIALGGQVRTGLDVFVPHEYILARDDTTGAPDVLVAIRPGFVFASGDVDVRFDAVLVVPVASRLAVEVGGGVFSFDSVIRVKGSAGLSLAL